MNKFPKILPMFILAALLAVYAYGGGVDAILSESLMTARKNRASSGKNVTLQILPLKLYPSYDKNLGVNNFINEEFLIKKAEPVFESFYTGQIPPNYTPVKIEFLSPAAALNLPGMKLKNTSAAGAYEVKTYEADAYTVTQYLPKEYFFAGKKTSAGDLNVILRDNLTEKAAKLVINYKNANFNSLIVRMENTTPSMLVKNILPQEKEFKDAVSGLVSENGILAGYKISDKQETTIIIFALQ